VWLRLYKGGSSIEGGTLQQLRNLINRRNISVSSSVSGHVNEIEDFLEIVSKSHLIAAALHLFSMTIDDEPHSNCFPASAKEKTCFMRNCIIDRYVIPSQFCLKNKEPIRVSLSDISCNSHLKCIMSEHDYSQKQSESRPVIRLLPPSISRTMEKPEAAQTIQQCAVDGVSQYASAVLNDGLLLLEFKDAIREGDGPRILRCYKALLLYYCFAKHYNYCKEAFRTLATVNALATPRVAQQITWSRVVNVNGRPVPVTTFQ